MKKLKIKLMQWLIGSPEYRPKQIVVAHTPSVFDHEEVVITYCTFDFLNWQYVYWCINFDQYNKSKKGEIIMPVEIWEKHIKGVRF